MTTSQLSWSDYAAKYDMLLKYNPFYQSLLKEVLAKTDQWTIQEGDVILDICAGTGNYSSALAMKFPQARVIHIDNNDGMNQVAMSKKETYELSNLEIRKADITALQLDRGSVKAFTCIHALYTLEDPLLVLKKIYNWLSPNGYGILVDPGRKVNVLQWQIAIGYSLIKNYGISKTLNILKEGKEVSKQNQAIRKLQDQGVYWTHTHQEFCDSVEEASFKIIESGLTFRKISDLAVVRK